MFVLIIFFFVYLIGCSSGINEDSAKESVKGFPAQELWDARVNFTEGELKRAVLEAHYIAKYEDEKITKAKELKLTFNDSVGKPYGILFSDSGLVDDQTNAIQFLGNVKFFTFDGDTLWADSLRWDPKDELIKTRSKIKLVRESEIIEANGLETDIRLEKIRFLGGVKGKAKGEL